MKRLYQIIVEEWLVDYRKMVFISGPRQVGKTTISKNAIANLSNAVYLNWDYLEDREKILSKHHELFSSMLLIKSDHKPRVVMDEIHKYKNWKNLIKGFYDKFGEEIEFIITGSAKLNIYKKGGDSLMGRYINMTIHPLTVAEVTGSFNGSNLIQEPKNTKQNTMENLLNFGGFAEPYLKSDIKFHRIWSKQRFEQLFREDIRSVEDIRDIYSLELLAAIIRERVGMQTNYTSLSNKIRVSDKTLRRWLTLLQNHYYCFSIRPWSTNIVRSLIKEPKYYLWDWSQIQDAGARYENFVASHLLKAVSFWNEKGFGDFGLYYLRDKDKREVDFVVVKDNKPWILVEAKVSDLSISQNLKYFHEATKAEYAFQVVQNHEAISNSCFDKTGMYIVPASTFLSQLV